MIKREKTRKKKPEKNGGSLHSPPAGGSEAGGSREGVGGSTSHPSNWRCLLVNILNTKN